MYIDTHAHLSSNTFKDNIEDVIKRANENGIEKMISIGCSIEEAVNSVNLAEKYPNVFATAGLYPHSNIEEHEIPDEEKLKIISLIAENPKVKAIGECGLDYKDPSPDEIARSKEDQKKLFIVQIGMAREKDLPVIIHSRQATEDTLGILKTEMAKGNFNAVWHCFTESFEVAEQAVSLGLMISITGIVTYPSGKKLREAITKIPIQNLMIETDAPLLVPEPLRTEGITINEPSYVKIIAEEIAKIKNISPTEVEETTTNNAFKFFKL